MTLLELPEELLVQVAHFLDAGDVCRLAGTCKTLHSRLCDDVFGKELYLSRWGLPPEVKEAGDRDGVVLSAGDIPWWAKFKERHLLEKRVDETLQHMQFVHLNDQDDFMGSPEVRDLCPAARAVSRLSSWSETLAYLRSIKDAPGKTRLTDKLYADKSITAIHKLCAETRLQELCESEETDALHILDGFEALAMWQGADCSVSIREKVQRAMEDYSPPENPSTEHDKFEHFRQFFCETLGFHAHAERYYDVCNSDIHWVFDNKKGIPITLSALFMALAQLAGIETTPVNFPGHFVISVSLDEETVYVDVFDRCRLMSKEQLQQVAGPAFVHHISSPPRPRAVWQRCERNVRAVLMREQNATLLAMHYIQLAEFETDWRVFVHMCHIFTSVCPSLSTWLPEMLQRLIPTAPPEYRDDLQHILDKSQQQRRRIEQRLDLAPRPRTEEVRYRVGQVMRHKRYNYTCVLLEWDYKCEQSDVWQHQMRIADLPLGANQPFYHVLADDVSRRYVAQENLQELPPHERSVFAFEDHTDVSRRFQERREDGTYVPNAALRLMFPDDA